MTILRRPSGFTLLELLISLAIFTVLATMAYAALNSVLGARKQVEAKSARLAELQTALMVLERDVEQAAPRGIRDEFGDNQPALQGGGVGTMVLALTREGWRNPLGLARSNLQRVAYQFNNKQLIRQSWSILDRASNTEPYNEVLLDEVTAVEVRFLGQDGQWSAYWPPQVAGVQGIDIAQPPQGAGAQGANVAQPSAVGGVLSNAVAQLPPPRAVEINLDVEGWGRITRLFRVPG
jgi:general secretion pathway protein J